jgi:hypothetical protein
MDTANIAQWVTISITILSLGISVVMYLIQRAHDRGKMEQSVTDLAKRQTEMEQRLCGQVLEFKGVADKLINSISALTDRMSDFSTHCARVSTSHDEKLLSHAEHLLMLDREVQQARQVADEARQRIATLEVLVKQEASHGK